MQRGYRFLVFLTILCMGAKAVPARMEAAVAALLAAQGERSLIYDGSFVHNIGELQVNVTNWGVLGSFPGSMLEMADAPSVQWPAASGVEYLYAGGLWVGAKPGGIARVSTALPDREFLPGNDPHATIYESFSGALGGNRFPSLAADDDADGARDEDPLNGLDDDGDGAVDEDFAAVSDQYFRCSYRDDLEASQLMSPDHHPLGIEVVQESYQWESDALDDFVGIEYCVRNVGDDELSQVYLGFFADPDVGHRVASGSYRDDLVDLHEQLHCIPRPPLSEPARLLMAIAYDKDGDIATQHPAGGQLGIMLLGHSTDPRMLKAPPEIDLNDWQVFAGLAPFSEGGEPTNDEQRYELLSRHGRDHHSELEQDYRMLISAGPFNLSPGDSVALQLGLALGEGRAGLIKNAIEAQTAFDGEWFDLDPGWESGYRCIETKLYDPDESFIWRDPCNPFALPVTVAKGQPLWVNADCAWENYVNAYCRNQIVQWCTGTQGRESNLHWMADSPPPPPNLRVWPTEGAMVLFWDDFSENVPDYSEQVYDFEGYMIWRADGWERPPGSTESNGPPESLWMVLGEYDLANGIGVDLGLETLRYQPNVDADLVAWYEELLLAGADIHSGLDYLPPTGFSLAEADTAIALARRELGMPGGKTYYRYADTEINPGMFYFYGVSAVDHAAIKDQQGNIIGYRRGLTGSPSNGFVYASPQSASQPGWSYDQDQVYVVPNPATRETMRPWTLFPNQRDASGVKVEFRHLPAALATVRIYTLAGDLVQTLRHDPSEEIAAGDYESTGTLAWNLVSRNGQDVASGVYIFVVEADGFPRKLGHFTVVR